VTRRIDNQALDSALTRPAESSAAHQTRRAAGTGKTAVIYGAIQRIIEGR